MRIDALHSVSKLYQTNRTSRTQTASRAFNSDKVEISQLGKDYQIAKTAVADTSDVREDLVEDIKARIADGTYSVSSEAFADKVVEEYAAELVF